MKVIQFNEYGSYEQLKLTDIPEPALTGDQLLVRVTFAAVNPVDNTIRSGLIPQAKKPPMILGNEAAGIVVRGNTAFPNGTRVIVSGFTAQGTCVVLPPTERGRNTWQFCRPNS